MSKATVLEKAKEYSVDITEGYPVDMGRVFRIWYTWGFWANAVAIVGAVATFIISAKNAYASKIVYGCTTIGFLVNYFVWIAIGTVWRFSMAGTAAAGDKLDREPGIKDETWEK